MVAPIAERRSWTSTDSWSERGEATGTPSLSSIRASGARLDATARLILRDPELAQDAVQETLIRAWRSLPGLRDPATFDHWLHSLVASACIDLIRKRRRRVIEVELTPIDDPPTTDGVAQVVDRDLLDRALARLEPEARAVVVLHLYLDMPLPGSPPRSASRSGRPNRASIDRSERCAPPSRSRRSRPWAPLRSEGRSHDHGSILPAERVLPGSSTSSRTPVPPTTSRPPSSTPRPDHSVPRGRSPKGGSPWLTSPAGPRSPHASRGGRSASPSSSSRLVAAALVYVGSHRRKLPPPFGLAPQRADALRLGRRHLYRRIPATGAVASVVGRTGDRREPVLLPGWDKDRLLADRGEHRDTADIVVVGRGRHRATVVTTGPVYARTRSSGRPTVRSLIVDRRPWPVRSLRRHEGRPHPR